MRFLIVLFGVLAALIAAAGAFLPRLVDAEAIRARLVAEAQAAIGRPIAVRGGAELTLLPSPLLSVGRVTIGSNAADGSAVLVEMDRLDLDVAPASLLTGAVEVVGARVVRPRATLRQQGRELADLLAILLQGGGELRSARVIDGRVTVERSGLPPEVLEQIELELARAADRGIEAHGGGRWRQQPWSVDLELGDPGAASARVPVALTVTAGGSGHDSRASLRGQLGPLGVEPLAAAAFEGEVEAGAAELSDLLAIVMTAAGHPGPAARLQLGPASLAGKLRHAGSGWRLDLTSSAIAGGELTGHVDIDAAQPAIDLVLDAARLNPSPDLVRGAIGAGIGWALPAGLTGTARVGIASLGWRGSALRDVRLAGRFAGDDSLTVERLAARLPDEGEISLEGKVTGLSGARSWEGLASVSLQDARSLITWLGLPEPSLAPDRLRIVSGTAGVGWSGRQGRLRNLDVRLGSTRITGSAALALEARPQLAAALAVDRLALDGYLPSGGAADLAAVADAMTRDLDLALDIDVGVLSWEAVRAEQVKLRAEAEDRKLSLHELSVGDLAEATGSVVGDADFTTGQVQLAIEAEIARPSRLARLAGYEPPALLGRLGTVQLSGTARRQDGDLAIEAGASSEGLTLDIAGRLPIGLDGPPRLDRLTAETADFAALARQMGLPAESALQGKASFVASATPRGRGIVDLAASADIAASSGQARLRYAGQETPPKLTGLVGIDRLDAGLTHLLWDIGEVALGFPPGPPSRWPGVWPRDPLTWGWLYAADLDVAVDGLAKGRLTLASGNLGVAMDEVPLAGGRLSGRIALDGGDVPPRLAAEVDLTGAEAAEALALVGLRSGLRGALDLEADLDGSGAYPAAIVASLAGTVRARLAAGAIEGVRLGPVDVLEAGPAELPVASLAGDLAVDRGIVSGRGLELKLPDETASLDVDLDLPAWILDATIHRQGRAQPMRLLGPPGRIRSLQPALGP